MRDPADAVREIRQDLERTKSPVLVYLLGPVDSGKTTFARRLVTELGSSVSAARVDCDPGQSDVGPPATVGLELGNTRITRFVGATSPKGHLLQILAGAKRLIEKAHEQGAQRIVLDTPGLVAGGLAREFQFHMIDLLRVDRIVAFQRSAELESLLEIFDRRATRVDRLGVSRHAVARSSFERRDYREERFREYFANALVHDLPLGPVGLHGRVPERTEPDAVAGRLVGLLDGDGFVCTLALIHSIEPKAGRLRVFAPPFAVRSVCSVQFGSIGLRGRLPPDPEEV